MLEVKFALDNHQKPKDLLGKLRKKRTIAVD
jgi:hypothetical protein